jgi:hypothetical protein
MRRLNWPDCSATVDGNSKRGKLVPVATSQLVLPLAPAADGSVARWQYARSP